MYTNPNRPYGYNAQVPSLALIRMCHCYHLSLVVSQVESKKTVTVHQTLRLCEQRVQVEYGGW